MRVLFALMFCSHAATLAAAGVQLNDPVDAAHPAWLENHRAALMAPMARTLDFASTVHLTIDRDPTGSAPAHSQAAPMLDAPSMLHSFDIAVFNDAESQPTAPVEFTTASAIPAPASLLLIVLGGLIALRR